MKGHKKRKIASQRDLWKEVGGLEAVVNGFSRANLQRATYSSDVWSELRQTLFGNENKSQKHWLWVIWNNNRRGLRDTVCGPHWRRSVEVSFKSAVHSSGAMPEKDNSEETLELREPKHNVFSLSASPSSNPMSQSDLSRREREIQFVGEVKGTITA